jgi:D-glycerate 3-kinase|tara:strand:- start:58 stop:1002 length:945 start_codon:yes stop_codon:yes gene_type:complete
MINFPHTNDTEVQNLLHESRETLFELAREMKIDDLSEAFLEEIVIPISLYLIKQFPKREKPYFICFTGGQGSGKTTLSFFVQKVLNETFNRPAMGFSIDDIYKSQEERRALANNVHPLCYVRGVPGTHDINMGLDLIDQLSRANQDTQTKIPSFCKPEDKHYPIEDWPVYIGKPDFIFFDAWCGGARPLPEEDWLPPLNQLEAEEDPDGIWSKWSNKELSKDYQTLFSLFDVLLMIKVPSMDFVYESRWIQEQTLAKTVTDPVLKKKIMTRDQVYRFVMHYERLTHYILEELPDFSDIVLSRDGNFKFSISKTP